MKECIGGRKGCFCFWNFRGGKGFFGLFTRLDDVSIQIIFFEHVAFVFPNVTRGACLSRGEMEGVGLHSSFGADAASLRKSEGRIENKRKCSQSPKKKQKGRKKGARA